MESNIIKSNSKTECYIKNVNNAFRTYITQEEDSVYMFDILEGKEVQICFTFTKINKKRYDVVCSIDNDVINGIYWFK
jgi:hypothetical protein